VAHVAASGERRCVLDLLHYLEPLRGLKKHAGSKAVEEVRIAVVGLKAAGLRPQI
jgi:hypothetical protein